MKKRLLLIPVLCFILLFALAFAQGKEDIAFAQNGDIRIAVIDSGLNTAGLENHKIENGYNFIGNNNDVTDNKGHGTNVAKIILEYAPDVVIIPLKCFDVEGKKSLGGKPADLARAVRYAVDTAHADIINMSWTLENDNAELRQALQYAYDSGVVLIAASGNRESALLTPVLYPAGNSGVIGVGSDVQSGSSYAIESFTIDSSAMDLTCYGHTLDGEKQGTSYSAPRIAAAAALVLENYPSIKPQDMVSLFSKNAIPFTYKRTRYYHFDPEMVLDEEGNFLLQTTSTISFIFGQTIQTDTYEYGDSVVPPTVETDEGYTVVFDYSSTAGFEDKAYVGEKLCSHEYMLRFPDSDKYESGGYTLQTVSEDTLLSSATCTQKAVYKKSCVCGAASETFTFESGETAPHDYIVGVVEPSCTQDGYTEHVCRVCGYSFTDEPTNAKGHTFVSFIPNSSDVPANGATCTLGVEYKKICMNCGLESDESFYYGEPLGHEFDGYVPGEVSHSKLCKRCEQLYDEEAHTFENGVCVFCGAEEHIFIEYIPSDDEGLLRQATCTERAVYKKVCSICGIYSELSTFYYGTTSPHDLVYTQGGSTHRGICSECGFSTGDKPHEYENNLCILCGYKLETTVSATQKSDIKTASFSVVKASYVLQSNDEGALTSVSLQTDLKDGEYSIVFEDGSSTTATVQNGVLTFSTDKTGTFSVVGTNYLTLGLLGAAGVIFVALDVALICFLLLKKKKNQPAS